MPPLARQLRRHPPGALRAGAPLLALLAGCTIITDFSSERLMERTEERCSDRVDNDGNGLADCRDPSCRAFDFCQENTEPRCTDRLDNDADDLTDCKDPECCGYPSCAAEPTCGERSAAACADGRDNDRNGLTDCADFSCTVDSCCRQPLPLLTETFSAAATACQPPDCSVLQEECCAAPPAPCNAFDSQRWIAWGVPSPRITDEGFTPNQPCKECGASGIISTIDALFSPHLQLEFDADLHGEFSTSIAVGLTSQAVIPRSAAPCGGIQSAYPLLAGIILTGNQIQAVAGGLVRTTIPGRPKGQQHLALQVSETGTIRFALGEKVFHEAPVVMGEPYPRVRLIIQGSSAQATVDNVLLARHMGCPSLDRWVAGPTGPGPVLSPPPAADRFDNAAITSPAVIYDGKGFRLYYSGRSLKGPNSRLGMATSTDGQSWTLTGAPLEVQGEISSSQTDPFVLQRAADYLLAYVSRSPNQRSRIDLATSTDGLLWKRIATAVMPGEGEAWDGEEIASPTLLQFRNRTYLWYVGQGKTSPLPSLGLATSSDGLSFVKSPFNPVLRPSVGQGDDRGVTDPSIIVDGPVLHLYYVGLTWGGQTQINLAASEDGRNWLRYPGNPLLVAGDPGLFGGSLFQGPTVLQRWGSRFLWYSGADPAGLPSIGYAVNTGQAR